MRGHAIRAARKLTLFIAALGLTVPAALATAQPAQAALIVHVRTATLPLSGSITGASEQIAVTGSITVTVLTRTNTGGGGTAQIISRLGGTSGIGATTGARYLFVGADNNTVSWPPGPIAPLTVFPRFLQINPFFPPDPIVPPHPIAPVRVDVSVTETGVIDSIDAELDEEEEGPDVST
ncbi:hypothetical protein ABZ725_17805 [Streptomyces sp. NPDC006872]|uniref:hypothetical protein n=1 Tax=Streptomyces sp. NPDC006872 TaxID=3155720 RepID=UPI0033FEA3AC